MKNILLSVLLLTAGTSGFCTKWTISDAGFTFSPATITITVGDSVDFSIANIHNAVEISQTTWNANGTTPITGFSVPFGGGLVLPAQLTAGTHYYICTAHASMGMKGIIIVQNSTGIMETQSLANISVYPNPSNGNFQLTIGNSRFAKSHHIEIYNIQGKSVYETMMINEESGIELNDLPHGIYFIKIYTGQTVLTKKIVIQ